MDHDRPLAMVLISDPDIRTPSIGNLAELFGLTPAEGRLAMHLADGKRLKDIATIFGVSMSTLRTQLSSVLKKAGVERQTDLVRIIGNTSLIDSSR